MKKKIVDFFPYFNRTGKELLELRVNLLKDYVDKFVICESNKTHSGIPLDYDLDKTIQELGLPKDKIQIIQLNIPEDHSLKPQEIDYVNCYEDNKNITSVRARTRERLQKDSILSVLNEFSDDTLFLISDSDEIINPKYIDWVGDMVLRYPRELIKIPLAHLEGRADLRVFNSDGSPKLWDRGMFMCTKHHLKLATPTQLRSNAGNPFPVSYICENNVRVEDMGWHFSWMGDVNRRKIKRESFTHYSDKFSFLHGNSFNSKEIADLHNADPVKGQLPPSGEVNTVLQEYPVDALPELIFQLPRVTEFLLPKRTSSKIVDVFTYFNEEELLELRYHMLKNYVDEFVIVDANYTYSGIPKEYTAESTITKLGLPKERFKVINADLSQFKGIDNPWVREEFQKDVVIEYLLTFDDDVVFNISDCDEIIDPLKLKKLAEEISKKSANLIYVPMTLLYCRADLMSYDEHASKEDWNRNSFVCSKEYLKRNKIFNTRNTKIAEAKIPDEECGWHFSWMGDKNRLLTKIKSFSHYKDQIINSSISRLDSPEMHNHILNFDPLKEDILTRDNYKVKSYDINLLPKEIFQLPRVKNLLLPEKSLDIFDKEYEIACNTPTDINEHVSVLHELALECETVTEMGVRTGVSTRAFLNTSVKLRSFDLELDPEVKKLFDLAKDHGKNVDYVKADVTKIQIAPTDLLFIDTWHCYQQLKQELALHAKNVKKYIAFHDTHIYGTRGEDGDTLGLLPAIIEFLIEHPEWRFKIHRTNNNGFSVIERITDE